MESIQDLFQFENDVTQFETDALENLERFNNIKKNLESYCGPNFEKQYDQIKVSDNVDIQTGVSILDPQQPNEIGYAQIKLIWEELSSIKRYVQAISKSLISKMEDFFQLDRQLMYQEDFQLKQQFIQYIHKQKILDSPQGEKSIESQTFYYYKKIISIGIYKIVSEPYLSTYFNQKIPFLDEFIGRLRNFLYKIHNDFINRNQMDEFFKLKSDFIQCKEKKEQLQFETYKQIKDLIMKSICYYHCIKFLIQIRCSLDIITFTTSQIKFYLDKSGFLELIQGKFSDDDFQQSKFSNDDFQNDNQNQLSKVQNIFTNYYTDDIFKVINFCESLDNYYIKTEINHFPEIIAKLPYHDDFIKFASEFQITDSEINFVNLFSQNGEKSFCFCEKQLFVERFKNAINFGNKFRFQRSFNKNYQEQQKEKEKKPRQFGKNK